MSAKEREDDQVVRIAQFLYEAGVLRHIPRAHQSLLHAADPTDSIASHTFRVAIIGWHLAKLEKADPYTVVMMCLLHDLGEARTNDHNWVHKRYIKIFDREVMRDQLGTLPFGELYEIGDAYHERASHEARVAKDADRIDQLLLLREYELSGNVEATQWLRGKEQDRPYAKLDALETSSGRVLGRAVCDEPPSRWWEGVWTERNREA